MAIKTIAPISDHYLQARGRLHQFIKDIDTTLTIDGQDFNGWEAMVHAFVSPAQGLEDIMNEMLVERSIETAVGVNMDRIGQIVGASRSGLPDDQYINKIFAQIAANNSNTTARDLLSVVTAMAGEDLQILELTEGFPAKVTLNYLLETPVTIDGTNNTMEVRVPPGAFEPVLVPQGTYFPYELAGLTKGVIESAPSWTNPIEVTWDQVLREYTLNISDSFPSGEVRPQTYAPLIGFVEDVILTGVAVSTTPIAPPTLNPVVLIDALNQAKAAGVDVITTIQVIVDAFVFSNTVSGLGFASLQALFNWTGFDNYVFLELGFPPSPSVTFLKDGPEYYFYLLVPTANANAFEIELNGLNDGEGGISFFAQGGNQVNFFGSYRVENAVIEAGVNLVKMYITDVGPGYDLLGTMFWNLVPLTTDALVANMLANLWTRADKVAFEAANPLGLGKGASPLGGANVGGGAYTTVLT